MRATKGREKVVERVLVGQIDDRKLRAYLVFIAVENVVVPQRNIEHTARGDALRMMIVVFPAWGRHL